MAVHVVLAARSLTTCFLAPSSGLSSFQLLSTGFLACTILSLYCAHPGRIVDQPDTQPFSHISTPPVAPYSARKY